MENFIWIILIIFLCILSFLISRITKWESFRLIKLFKSLKKDKTSLFFSLGTKMGVGSIIGTTISIFIGGAGSLFWIWIFSLISFSLIYFESYLGGLYKVKHKDTYIGGPYFYIKNGLKKNVLALISLFVLMLTYSFLFQMIQVNTISNLVLLNINVNKIVMLIILLVILISTVIFKPRELLDLLNKIVPFMCILFVSVGLLVIIKNFSMVGSIFKLIFKEAFNLKSLVVGMVIGVKRSVFLNEIMIGTTSVTSSSSDEDNEISSRIQVIGGYFITFVICTIIGFMVLIFKNNIVENSSDYLELLNNVFLYHFSSAGGFILLLLALLFGVTTIISGFYIGLTNFDYLYNSKLINIIFSILFIISSSVGMFLQNSILWNIVDILMFVMIVINSYSIIRFIRK